MVRDELEKDLAEKLNRQVFANGGFEKIATAAANIRTLLEIKEMTARVGPVWDQFFAELPQSNSDTRFPMLTQNASLKTLAQLYKGPIQVIFTYIMHLYCTVRLISPVCFDTHRLKRHFHLRLTAL